MYCHIEKIRQYVVRLGFFASIGDFENVAPIYREIIKLLALIQADFDNTHKSDESSDDLPC